MSKDTINIIFEEYIDWNGFNFLENPTSYTGLNGSPRCTSPSSLYAPILEPHGSKKHAPLELSNLQKPNHLAGQNTTTQFPNSSYVSDQILSDFLERTHGPVIENQYASSYNHQPLSEEPFIGFQYPSLFQRPQAQAATFKQLNFPSVSIFQQSRLYPAFIFQQLEMQSTFFPQPGIQATQSHLQRFQCQPILSNTQYPNHSENLSISNTYYGNTSLQQFPKTDNNNSVLAYHNIIASPTNPTEYSHRVSNLAMPFKSKSKTTSPLKHKTSLISKYAARHTISKRSYPWQGNELKKMPFNVNALGTTFPQAISDIYKWALKMQSKDVDESSAFFTEKQLPNFFSLNSIEETSVNPNNSVSSQSKDDIYSLYGFKDFFLFADSSIYFGVLSKPNTKSR